MWPLCEYQVTKGVGSTRVNSRIVLRAAPWLPWNATGGGDQGWRRCGGGYKLHPLLLQPRTGFPDPPLRGIAASRGVRSSLRTAASDYCVWNDYGSAVWGRGVARSRTSLRLARWQLQKARGARGRHDYALRRASMSEAGARFSFAASCPATAVVERPFEFMIALAFSRYSLPK